MLASVQAPVVFTIYGPIEDAGYWAACEALVARLPEAPVIAELDATMISQAVTNLIKNAGEAVESLYEKGAPSGYAPEVRVSMTSTDDTIRITISDNGPGMTPEVLQQVKEPLFTTKNFGAGLGLPAVERIAELHGGGLDIHSSPGQGATVTIWLPVTQARSDAQAAASRSGMTKPVEAY